jgi:hypothetical protein
LQDYLDCRRRFQLRYVQEFAWPAVVSEPVQEHERFIQEGVAFHQLAHQLFAGVPADLLDIHVHGDELQLWWQNFRQFIEGDQFLEKAAVYPETSLTTAWGDHRVIAKYDLIVKKPDGRFMIYDWKTSRKPSGRQWLMGRIQTRLYPFLLALVGKGMNEGQAIEPQSIEMVYWFSSNPDQPARFPYSPAQYIADNEFLARLVDEITTLTSEQFDLTTHEERCAFCVYRSYCERGDRAGLMTSAQDDSSWDELPDVQLDFDNIAEINF